MKEVGVVTATPATLETVFETGDELLVGSMSFFYIKEFNRAYAENGVYLDLVNFIGYANINNIRSLNITLHKRGGRVLYNASKKEPRIPDENTPRGTRVLYTDFEENDWNKGYFEGFKKHNSHPFIVFMNGKDEWSSNGEVVGWKYCQIVEEE